jgi:hypothetical protein
MVKRQAHSHAGQNRGGIFQETAEQMWYFQTTA